MLRHAGIVTAWAVTTAVVVALGWAAVGTVTGAVSEPPPLAQPPAEPTEPAAPADARSFDLVGGSVGVRLDGDAAGLLFATPRPGFSVEVRERGPVRVDVRFASADHESRFRFDVATGPRVEERPG